MQHRNALKTSRPPSLIDVVSEGFAAANQRIWVLLIPIALDLVLWLAPRIGIAPLLAQARAINPTTWDQTVAAWGGDNFTQQLAAFDLRSITFFSPLRLSVPSLSAPAAPWGVFSWQLGSWAGMLGTLLVVNIVVLVLSALYVAPLADNVKHQAPRRMGAFVRTITMFLGVAALIVGTLFIASLVVLVVMGVVALVAQSVAMFVLILWITVATWFTFVTSFAFDAVALDGLNPVRAAWRSFVLVQRSLWAALGLWLLTTLIVLGFGVIWDLLAAWNSAGVVLAIIGSAYITTGLAAAHLVFYRNRVGQLAQRGTPQRRS